MIIDRNHGNYRHTVIIGNVLTTVTIVMVEATVTSHGFFKVSKYTYIAHTRK
jgi:hypothetical protein